MEGFAMKRKCLFKQDFVFKSPFFREWSEISKILKCFVYVMFMPEKHTKSLRKSMQLKKLDHPIT